MSHTTHPPTHSPSKDWVKFSSGPLADQNFSLAHSAPIGLDQKLTTTGGAGVGALVTPTHRPLKHWASPLEEVA